MSPNGRTTPTEAGSEVRQSSSARPISREVLRKYAEDGYAVIRNVIDGDLLAEANEHIKWLGRRYPDLRPEHYHHPLMRDDAFWVRLVTDARILDIAEAILGPDLACFTAHYICKPPRTGQPVLWHQDGAYWNLAPLHALTVWLAIDESCRENGCLQVIPGSHRQPIVVPELRAETQNMLNSAMNQEIVDDWIRIAGVVDIELSPGDVSIHHPRTIHGSKSNRSERRRCGLDMGFIATSTSIANRDLYLDPILARGAAKPGVNSYRRWPAYTPEESILFNGHDEWNERVASLISDSTASPDAETPIEITRRMMDRLRTGTVKS